MQATTRLHGKVVAHLEGTTLAELASISKVSPTKGLSKEAALSAVGVAVPSVEAALRKAGVLQISTSTHPTSSRVFKQMGYKASGRGPSPESEFMTFLKYDMGYKIPMRPSITDLRKDLAKRQPRFIVRKRPEAKKAVKRPAAKRRRRR